MLHLILGRARTGKTSMLLRQAGERGEKRPQVILVPEQVSHQMERAFCQACGPEASRMGEVLSFTRLAQRVFTQGGGLASPQLDGGGRLLLMSQAVASVSTRLKVYRQPSQKAAFLTQLLATGEELKSYCIQPEDLTAAGRQAQGETGDRLTDLGLILGAYDALTRTRASDPRDRITRLGAKLEECPWFRGKDVYLDAFTDFTPQQRLVLDQALRQAHSVTVALTCDGLEGGETVFVPARRTALALLDRCRQMGVPAEFQVLTRPDRADALSHLEAHLFSEGGGAPVEGGEEISLYAAESPYAEVEWAAGEILRLVKEEGWHFREIAVSARTLEGYGDLLETVFRRYQIPLFLGRVEPILEKPVLTLLTAALDSVRNHYEYEDLFRYLKTGLTGLSWEEVDRLENYVLRWDIRGSRWTRAADWTWHPQGYALPWREEDRQLLARLNELRRQVIAPLQALGSRKEGTGRELAMALYAFLEEIQLPQRLLDRTAQLREEGELQQAEEYRQLWQILTGALEQCAWLLEDQVMDLDYFTDLFRLVLTQYSVGAIPVSLDQVAGGEAPRLAHIQCKALFLLGVEDEHFPLISQSPGLLTDEDRLLLQEQGMETAPSAALRLDREQSIAYDIFTRPSQRLYLSYPKAAGGVQKRPALLWSRVEHLVPGHRQGRLRPEDRLLAPLPALELAAERGDGELLDRLAQRPGWEQVPQRVRAARESARGSLSRGAVQALYGREAALSASKMDKLKSCHFSYFLQYGLKAQPRRPAGFDAPETGTFVHYILEHVLQEGRKAGEGIRALDGSARQALVRQAVDRYIREELGGLEDQTPRFRYLFQRLLKSVELIVDNVAEELEHSAFVPIAFELGFGRGQDLPPVKLRVGDLTLSISGFVDRVDGWEKDGRLYLRVVDYKTGRKSFSLTDVWHGLSLQMLLYLFTLRERGEDYFGKPVSPAGVLYLPARDILLPGNREMDPDRRRKEADKALRRSGLLLEDGEVLRAMEDWGPEGPRFLPLRVTKSGAISGESLASAEQWGRLEQRLQGLLQEMGREIARGNIDADPYLKGGGHTACDFCDFAQACHFEEGRGRDRRRYLYQVKGKAFWEKTKAETEKGRAQP